MSGEERLPKFVGVKMELLRTYSELIRLPTFIQRFEYLRLDGIVGATTFGSDRYLNQLFYTSEEWRRIRDIVIIRDNGCDLAIDGYDIPNRIVIHHMNPITVDDVLKHSAALIDPEFLVCVSDSTHKAIHYGDAGLLPRGPVERIQNDTCPWKL